MLSDEPFTNLPILILLFPVLYFFKRSQIFKYIAIIAIICFGIQAYKNFKFYLYAEIPENIKLQTIEYIISSSIFITVGIILLIVKKAKPKSNTQNIIDSDKY